MIKCKTLLVSLIILILVQTTRFYVGPVAYGAYSMLIIFLAGISFAILLEQSLVVNLLVFTLLVEVCTLVTLYFSNSLGLESFPWIIPRLGVFVLIGGAFGKLLKKLHADIYMKKFITMLPFVFFVWQIYSVVPYLKPEIVNYDTCSDNCDENYNFMPAYSDVKNPILCLILGGEPHVYYGWNRFVVCEANSIARLISGVEVTTSEEEWERFFIHREKYLKERGL